MTAQPAPQQILDQLQPVLEDLAAVADGITEEQWHQPTPCSEYDVAMLTGHVVGWLEAFTAGFASPDGTCPSLDAQPETPREEAGPRIRAASQRMAEAVADGAAERPLVIGTEGVPGEVALGMILGEYVIHGWDLATATGQDWAPDKATVETAHAFYRGMVTLETRAEGLFGEEVHAPADASALERFAAFTGREPR